MRAIIQRIQRMADHRWPVLILGETGTGKELIARLIHAESSGGPFVVIDCSTIPSHLMESELFGYVRGAFTGAVQAKTGLIEAAHGGQVERLGGVGNSVAKELAKRTGKETRSVVLGHLQRGGAPTSFDRTLATRFGGKAVELLRNGQFGKMVANHPPDLVPIPLHEVVGKTKLVPLDSDLVLTARALGVSFGD